MIVLFGKKDDKECFFLLKKPAGTDSYTVTEVDPAEKLLIGAAAYPLSSLMPVSYSETVEVSVDTYEQQSGSKLTLTVNVASRNGKMSGKKARGLRYHGHRHRGELFNRSHDGCERHDDYGMDSSHPGRIHHPRGCDRGWRLCGLQLENTGVLRCAGQGH